MTISAIENIISNIEAGDHEDVLNSTVVHNEDGTFSVCDNGEEVVCKDAQRAAQIVKENAGE